MIFIILDQIQMLKDLISGHKFQSEKNLHNMHVNWESRNIEKSYSFSPLDHLGVLLQLL